MGEVASRRQRSQSHVFGAPVQAHTKRSVIEDVRCVAPRARDNARFGASVGDSNIEPFEHAEEIERRLGLPSGFLARRRASPGGPFFGAEEAIDLPERAHRGLGALGEFQVATSPIICTPAEFGAYMAGEVEKWSKVVVKVA
jgi:hypothetical protein